MLCEFRLDDVISSHEPVFTWFLAGAIDPEDREDDEVIFLEAKFLLADEVDLLQNGPSTDDQDNRDSELEDDKPLPEP